MFSGCLKNLMASEYYAKACLGVDANVCMYFIDRSYVLFIYWFPANQWKVLGLSIKEELNGLRVKA